MPELVKENSALVPHCLGDGLPRLDLRKVKAYAAAPLPSEPSQL
jgi:hypothetical protein